MFDEQDLLLGGNNKIAIFFHCLKFGYISWYFLENDIMLRHEILC